MARCSWANRFDDPTRLFRTLYCALAHRTALREVLQQFSPSTKALREFAEIDGISSSAIGRIAPAWLRSQAIGVGELRGLKGPLVRLGRLAVRSALELELLDLFVDHGIDRLDISCIRSREMRAVTQEIARHLYARGAAGIIYRSNLDDQLCLALFEGRAELVPVGSPEPIEKDARSLSQVCRELHIRNP